MAMIVILAYDIASDTRRARLARRAGGLGLPAAGVRFPTAAGAR